MLVRFTQIDYHNEMALVAVRSIDNREEQIGVARYTTSLDKKSCEFALVVSDQWRGRGIAHHLMRRLMQIARDRDLERIEGQVLGNNVKMLQLMKSMNFQISNDADDPSVKVASAQLHSANP
jgi:acetyltransferase